jgi:hypothetical protein
MPLLLAAFAAAQVAQPLEVRGTALGSSLEAFKQAKPAATCTPEQHNVTVCREIGEFSNLQGFNSFSYRFSPGNKLYEVLALLEKSNLQAVFDSLKSKWGDLSDFRVPVATWRRGRQTISANFECSVKDICVWYVDEVELEKVRDAERRRNTNAL